MSSRSVSANTGSSVSAVIQRSDSQQSYVKKPPPLEIKMPSQDNAAPVSASSGQKTPPAFGLAHPHFDSSMKEKKIGHRRVDEQTGQVTYKKKATSDLMKAIQLGIGQSVGSLTSKPTRDVLMQDFSVVETVIFPENGSNLTPAHRAGEFTFKTYAPIAFRYFRELFGIQTDDFLISLASLPLIELSNPGASGSVFFITEDDEFIIKTVQHKEADFLQKLLPGYYMNLNQNPRTLLPKFYGLYCLQAGGKNIRLCVMNNLLPKAIRKSEKYDLKGSTYKRKASKHELAKGSPTFKDLDYKDRNPDGLLLEAETYEALMKTIRRDCRVLESFKIMDYSLLLCIYNVDETKKQQLEELRSTVGGPSSVERLPDSAEEPTSPDAVGAGASFATPGPITRGRSTKQRLQHFSTAMESIQAEAGAPVELEDEDVPPGGIPARNGRGERLLLYAGVIDILQSYRLKKKLEHGFKSIVYDGDTVSVHRPNFYAHRFQTFFEKDVFKKIVSPIRSPSKKKATGRQRSLTEPAPSTSAESSSATPEAEGALLNRNKPDIIPRHSEESSRSGHTFDPKWSGTTMSSSQAFSTSSVSTGVQSYLGSYLSKEPADSSSTVLMSRSAGTHPNMSAPPATDDPLPPYTPPGDDPLPPYSEMAPTTATQRALDSQRPHLTSTDGGARSKLYKKKGETIPLIEVSQTVSAPSVLEGSTELLGTKSAIRKDKLDRTENKKGVRFSHSEEDDGEHSDNEDSELLPNPLVLKGSAGLPIKSTSRDEGESLIAAQTEDGYAVLRPLSSDIPVRQGAPDENHDNSTALSTDEITFDICRTRDYSADHSPLLGISDEFMQPISTTNDSLQPIGMAETFPQPVADPVTLPMTE